MTITENRPEVEAAEATPPARRPVAAPSGLAGWVMTADHKRIGRMYISVSLVGVAAALVVGALLAVERVDSAGTQIVELDAVVQLLSLYRYGLVFVGVLPLLLGLAIAIVPLQVGAYRIAFGRAAALSFWGWLIGSGLMIAAYAANGGPGGGNSEAVDLYLLSLALVVVSLLLGAVCVVTTALTLRTAGHDARSDADPGLGRLRHRRDAAAQPVRPGRRPHHGLRRPPLRSPGLRGQRRRAGVARLVGQPAPDLPLRPHRPRRRSATSSRSCPGSVSRCGSRSSAPSASPPRSPSAATCRSR